MLLRLLSESSKNLVTLNQSTLLQAARVTPALTTTGVVDRATHPVDRLRPLQLRTLVSLAVVLGQSMAVLLDPLGLTLGALRLTRALDLWNRAGEGTRASKSSLCHGLLGLCGWLYIDIGIPLLFL